MYLQHRRWRIGLLMVWLLSAHVACAGERPPVINYRSDGSGIYPNANPPLAWNATEAAPQGVLWCVPLPGPAEHPSDAWHCRAR